MNKIELLAYNYIQSIGYKDDDIIFNANNTPDFICSDGKRFEVKRLSGNKVLFSVKQSKKLRQDDTVLVFDGLKIVDTFKYGSGGKYKIHFMKSKVGYKIKLEEKYVSFLESHPEINLDGVVKKALDQEMNLRSAE